jgi:lysophospholipid acyltransferase (LPLAT)-like uncharacterized protein
MATFVSRHRTAQIATKLMKKKGINVIPVRISGNKTGPVLAAVKIVKSGSSLGIAPDGPDGPRRVVKPGAIMIASLSQARLSPVAFSTRRRIFVKTWDRFLLPLPYGRGAFVMADGDIPPRRMDDDQMAAAKKELTNQIDQVTREADRIVDQRG